MHTSEGTGAGSWRSLYGSNARCWCRSGVRAASARTRRCTALRKRAARLRCGKGLVLPLPPAVAAASLRVGFRGWRRGGLLSLG